MRHNLTGVTLKLTIILYLYLFIILGLLEGSLRSCNAQFEPGYVLDRLGVKLLEPSPGDTGWEIFLLDYKIDAPIAAVVFNYYLFIYF